MPSVHFVELQLKLTWKMLLLDYFTFYTDQLQFTLMLHFGPLANSSLVQWTWLHLGAGLQRQQHWSPYAWWLCSPRMIWCSSNTTSAEVMIFLDSEVNTHARETFWKSEICYLLCSLYAGELEERPLLLKQDCSKAKDNKCSRDIKISRTTSAPKLEGGHNSWVSRNHLWYIKTLPETCGSESH